MSRRSSKSFGVLVLAITVTFTHAISLEQIKIVTDLPDDPYTHCQPCMPKECGRARSPTGLETRVYGGSEVPRGRHPWIAMITDTSNNGSLIGSGVLISCNLVLTTAYNVQNRSPASIRVRLGAVNVLQPVDGELQFDIHRVIVHPEWKPENDLFSDDLALIQLNGSVDFSAANGYIAPICLPAKDRDYEGWLSVPGFGQNLNGTSNGELREADVYRLSRKNCQAFMDEPYTFCGLGNNKGLCNGDRGSPAVQVENDGRFSLAALANDYQCWPGGSDVYTATPTFIDWICSAKTDPVPV